MKVGKHCRRRGPWYGKLNYQLRAESGGNAQSCDGVPNPNRNKCTIYDLQILREMKYNFRAMTDKRPATLIRGSNLQ